MRFLSGFGLGLTALALVACGGDLTLPGSSASADKAGFNPFSQESETSFGQREVMKDPPVAEVMKAGELPEMSWGRADAPVTIIKYASLTCPFCKRFQVETYPQLKRDYIDTGKVRFIIREFPIGKASGTATVALRCAKPEKYLALYEKYLAQQTAWVAQEVKTDAIFGVASQVGMTRAEFELLPSESRHDCCAELGQGARTNTRGHRDAELLRQRPPGEVRRRHERDPRDGGSDPRRQRSRHERLTRALL